MKLDNALRPLIVEEGVEPEEIELRVMDAEGSRYVFRPRPDWMGLILKIYKDTWVYRDIVRFSRKKTSEIGCQ